MGSQDVWFGEWDAEAAAGDGAIGDKVAGTHNVWYVGESGDVATTLPTGAPVTYTVQSINNYTGATLPTSTLTANFDGLTASSTGDISFSGGAITNTGSDVQLAANGVNVASSGGTNGDLAGNFFGTGAAAVAGIVTFADRNQDTAFGGSKNP
ncbi:Slam-dependent surface lipoprotein [Brenneria nigrifluens]|uniref:Slam-dependent surface lipoprotein n=1 Tax=Brenneria nigrifluens TaxID=55210 RepID=UPI0002E1CEFF|nr:Slam-dependent surface lipoprotein [Brenneria nigrifluens]